MRDPGVEANARLTGYAGVVLAPLLAAELVTGLRFKELLPVHSVIGFVLVPPVLLKLGSVGYRFARYYKGDPRYRTAGPPRLAMRLLGPMIVVLTVVVFATGIELWLFGYRFGFFWVPLHHGFAYLWFVAMAIHVANYLRKAPDLAYADWRDHLRGAATRRSLLVGSLVLGVALAVAMLPFPTPFLPSTGGS
jgi:hypothetical protein